MVSIKGGCIHFDLTSAVKCKATIWTKQYFSSVLEAKADNYVYTDLSKASKEVNKIHNMFVVVQDVLKVVIFTLLKHISEFYNCFFYFYRLQPEQPRERITGW